MNYSELVGKIVEGMQDIKAEEITVLDLRKLENSVTDYFVICTANSTTHAEGIKNSVHKLVSKELQEKPWHNENTGESNWILLDYVSAVVHIFLRDTREYYNIEDLWADAERLDIGEEN